ncbi:MAG: hypothetical protein Q7S34_03365 [bacterium]|nr:hypothetical protein [bacterium]
MPKSKVARFGITPAQFKSFNEEYETLSSSLPRTRQKDGMVFYDWEAAAIARVYKAFENDKAVRAVIASMMHYVNMKNEIAGAH